MTSELEVQPERRFNLIEITKAVEDGYLLDAFEERQLAQLVQDGLVAQDNLDAHTTKGRDIYGRPRIDLPPAEKRVARKVVAKGQTARETFFRANIGLAYDFANGYGEAGLVDHDVVVQDALFGIWEATEKFLPDHPSGARFATVAHIHMFNRVLKSFGEHGYAGFRYPINIGGSMYSGEKLMNDLRQKFGREPEAQEFAAAASETMLKARKHRRIVVPLESGESYGTKREYTDSEGAPRLKRNPIDYLADATDIEADVVRRIVCQDLYRRLVDEGNSDPREKVIIDMRFGAYSEDGSTKTLGEVGDELGVTRERVRQIEAKALSKIRLAHYLMGSPSALQDPSDRELDAWVERREQLKEEDEQEKTHEVARRLGRLPLSELSDDEREVVRALNESYHLYFETIGDDAQDDETAELAVALADAAEIFGDGTKAKLDEQTLAHEEALSEPRETMFYWDIIKDARNRLMESTPDVFARVDLLKTCQAYIELYDKAWLSSHLLALVDERRRAARAAKAETEA